MKLILYSRNFQIIREGRAALVTSFGVFKYMAGYSLTQFVTIMQLYWLNTNLTDLQVLFLPPSSFDLISPSNLLPYPLILCSISFTVPLHRSGSCHPGFHVLRLHSLLRATCPYSTSDPSTFPGLYALRARPTLYHRLFSSQFRTLFCMNYQLFSLQVFTFIYTSWQPWFVPYATPIGPEVEDRRSMQGTAVFCVSMFQYITLAIIYSKGFPYRRPLYRFDSRILVWRNTFTLLSLATNHCAFLCWL